ncbi:MAG TPA: chorismate mutase [Polyangiaceae bacterium]|nr:chorismate mutase [Polyangiaceae bacterium]
MAAAQLRELRDQIDGIDRNILELLAQRLRLVIRVGDYKRANNLPIYDAERERDLLARVANAAPSPLEPAMAQRIFQCVIQESRDLEKRHVERK